ncbi:AarF/UbiB family protein [Saccharothrix sp. S26]|uniref:ABC1 kinase family protein n=1 Tax=Saccharothrix sp. S26 TaxID=2907215 RepID=UPI001F208F47|nr:AarF/UbiB family protein [Saccharothrix sp. S26]MCE6996133.1 AarF/UbiB family protein [Saccharothrix sp. S26]
MAWLEMTGRLRGRRAGLVLESWLAGTVVELGAAFVKAAQLLSTRADLLPPKVCRALARLHDQVSPEHASSSAALRGLGGSPATLVGSGSIACVYRVRTADGRDVAVKLRRPEVERSLPLDLALLEGVAGVLARLPVLRGAPVVEIARQLTGGIRAQLDLTREAELLDGFRRALADVPGVTVPAVDRESSTDGMLVMEFVGDLVRLRPEDLSVADRRRAVVTALRVVYRMLFLDGVVHCDLHPGNLYFREDGSIVVLDAGFTVRLSDSAREKFAAFFYCLARGDGPACADVVASTATTVPGADLDGFRAELVALVEANAGLRAEEFDLISFATTLFDVQRRHGLYADPQFVFPILSLLVLEGTVREFHPEVDFQREAKPLLVAALFERALVRGGASR